MSLFRYTFVALMLFSLAGVPKSFAGIKLSKAKITQQPVGQTVELGDRAEIRVAYKSSMKAKCQWRRNQVPLPGATGATYVIDAVLPEDAGNYDVVITTPGGKTYSRIAVLTVNLAPESLPLNSVVYGDLAMRIQGQSEPFDSAFLITGATTLQDPEAPSDTYTYAYARQSKDKAKLVIKGRFYDSDFGDYVTSKESYTLTFTGVSSDGDLLATASSKGYFIPPAGYSPSKLKFTAEGTLSIQTSPPASSSPSYSSGGTVLVGSGSMTFNGASSVTGGTLVLTHTGGFVSESSSLNSSANATLVNVNALSGGSQLVFPSGGTVTLNTGSLNLLDLNGVITLPPDGSTLSGFDAVSISGVSTAGEAPVLSVTPDLLSVGTDATSEGEVQTVSP